ncbi:EpsG family protein [Vibrio splendidus]
MQVYICANLMLFIIAWYDYKLSRGLRLLIDTLSILLLTFIFGLRTEVGADWLEYLRLFELYKIDANIFNHIEFSFKFINIFSQYFSLGYQGVILISTLLFVIFTIVGCRKLGINPYLFLGIIFPYYFVMSGMNYIRQSLGLSIFIIYLGYILENKKNQSWIALLLGMSFHKSVLIFSFLSLIDVKKRYLVFFGIPLSLLGLSFIVTSYSDLYISSSHYDSAGFLLRYLYVIISALFIFINRHEFSCHLKRLIAFSIVGSFFIGGLSFLTSTGADRLAYYFIVLNTILILLLSRNRLMNRFNCNFAICTCFAVSQLVFFVWSTWGSIVDYYMFNHLIFDDIF